MSNLPLPDYLVDYADDPTNILVPGHLGPEPLRAMLATLDLNDSDSGIWLDGQAMAASAKRIWLRRGTEAEFDEHGPPDPDGTLGPDTDYWIPCTPKHRGSAPWTQMEVVWTCSWPASDKH